jgi:lipid A disaccharide synthetase
MVEGSEAGMTRVVVCSGEPSGDAMVQELVPALRAQFGAGLHLGVLTSSPIDGLDEDEVLCLAPEPMLGLSIGAANLWKPALAKMSEILAEDPPDLFIAIAHHGFNLVLAAELKAIEGAKTATLMVAPPEIWAWNVRGWLRALGPLLRWVAPRRQSLPFVVASMLDRGRSTLRVFDGIACLTEPNLKAYRRLDRKHETGRLVVKVGHVFARYGDPHVQERVRDAARALRATLVRSSDDRLLALLPGSREAEVDRLLPTMLDAVERIRARFGDRLELVAGASDGRRAAQIRRILDDHSRRSSVAPIPLVTGQAEATLGAADFGLMCSGTVTLLAACLGVPSVVIYDRGLSLPLTLLGHLVLRKGRVSSARGAELVPFALPSAVVGERIFPELSMLECKPRRVAAALEKMIDDEGAGELMRKHQQRLLGLLEPSPVSAGYGTAADTPMQRVALVGLLLVEGSAERI